MPELSRFYGIVIRMYLADHGPAHFHALYGDDEALVGIEALAVLHGRLSPRAHGLVIEWASIHQDELRACWERASNLQQPGKVDPLP